jgi:hypothetical protein
MDKPTLQIVEDVDAVWERIRPGLQVIAEKDDHPWTPESLRESLYNKDVRIALFPEGFMLWYLQIGEFSGEVTFWAWAMYGEGANIFWKYEDEVCELARACGAEKIAFCTSRKGYPRKLRNTVWKLTRFTFEREL